MKNLSSSQLTELQQQCIQLQQSVQAIGYILGVQTSQPNDSPLVKPSLTRPTRKRSRPKLTTATFRYRYWDQHPECITRLYQCLLRAQWIAPDTNPDDFSALFEGNETPARITWIGKKTYLVYLFRLLTDLRYITMPTKSIGRWMIVAGHFVDAEHHVFTNLNSARIPLKAKTAIEKLADLLSPTT